MFHRTTLGVATAATLSLLAACQSTPPATTLAVPAQAWQQGRLPEQAGSTLAPVAGKLTATPAADIPLASFKLPPGFKAEVWASGMPGARAMVRAENGKIYIGTRGIGRVYELTDTGTARTSRVVVDKLVQPAGVAYANGSLYVMAIDKVLRYDGIATNPAAPAVQDMTAAFQAAEGTAPQLEVHRLRPGRQAVRALRRALQHLRAGHRIRAGAPLQRRRLGHGSHRPRRAQHAGLRRGIRKPRRCGSPTMAATGWATTARRTN